MSFKHIMISAACVFLLVACGNDSSSETNQSGSINDGEKKSTETKQRDEQQQLVDDKEQTSTADQDNSISNSTGESTSKEEIDNEEQAGDASVSTQSASGTTDSDETMDSEGFSVVDGEVEAAKDVPQEDEKAILAAFQEYIDAFNAKDIKRYEDVLAQHPEGFDLQEDLANSQQIFDNFDINRQVEHVTITDYDGKRAYVYADVIVDVKQDNNEARDEGKQLTQFVKESSEWKVTSLQAIGNPADQ